MPRPELRSDPQNVSVFDPRFRCASKPFHTKAAELAENSIYHIKTVKLAPREIEVLTLSAQGKMRREIAELLLISEATVKEYIQAACQKLGASNKTQASVFALLLGLITPYRPHGLAQLPIIFRKKLKKSPQTEGAKNFQKSLSESTVFNGDNNANRSRD